MLIAVGVLIALGAASGGGSELWGSATVLEWTYSAYLVGGPPALASGVVFALLSGASLRRRLNACTVAGALTTLAWVLVQGGSAVANLSGVVVMLTLLGGSVGAACALLAHALLTSRERANPPVS
jgi:hypothetical protein